MIRVEHVTKWYGATRAVHDLNFAIERGEVVGFLGPNGAGKTTTMRILAGALGPSTGRALIGGLDVAKQPRETKRMVGYLPEFPPLYAHMRVRPFLRFCARIKGAASPRRDVEEVVERVGLKEVADRPIEHLSKGYRQRVGIAQALVHKPPVLILDEPASGLDPKQRVEIRNLVKTLSEGETTVLLSTHVLSEVEKVCDRVLVIRGGVLVGQDDLKAMVQSGQRVRAVVQHPSDELMARLQRIDGVAEVVAKEGEYRVLANRDVRAEVASACVPHALLELAPEYSLEDKYLRLLGEGP